MADVFVLTNLERLKAESSRRDTEFREAAEAVIAQIQASSAAPRGGSVVEDGDADRYFRPFQLACEIRSPKIRIMALDCIERMIAFNFLRGAMKVRRDTGGADIALVDIIVEAVCVCKDDKSDDVQLRVIKAILTAVGSATVQVHEQTLLAAVKACLAICLTSKNQVTKNTAKTALRQVLNITFGRMEAADAALAAAGTLQALQAQLAPPQQLPQAPAEAPATPLAVAALPPPQAAPTPLPPARRFVKIKVKRTVRVLRPPRAALPAPVSAAVPAPPAPVAVRALALGATPAARSPRLSPFGPYMYAECCVALGYKFAVDAEDADTESAAGAGSEGSGAAATPAAEVAAEATAEATAEEPPQPHAQEEQAPEFDEVEVEEEEEVEEDAPAATVAAVVALAATASPKPKAAAASPAQGPAVAATAAEDVAGAGGRFASQAHKDAFMVFTLLCRGVLTMAGDSDISSVGAAAAAASAGFGIFSFGATPAPAPAPTPPAQQVMMSDDALLANPLALQYKLLSMDLVIGLLESCGSAMRNGARFIAAIKQYLCVGLLKNFVSSIPALSGLSLKTFMALMRGFKRHIAAEIEVFLSAVFMRMLASPASSHEQKMNVLAAFKSMCTDPGSVLEMFLNYDCTEGRQNVFEDSVRVLASIAQGRSGGSEGDVANASDKVAAEAALIKEASMQALAAVMSSIVLLADAAAKQMADNEAGGIGSEEQALAAARAAAAAAAVEDKDDDDTLDEVAGEGGAGPAAAAGAAGLSSPVALASPTGASAASAASSSSSGSGPAALSSSAALARSYDEQKKRRALLEKAAVKFAVKPKKGIEYMQSVGLCADSPASVAAIFHELRDVLDKTAIGEYMGEEKALNVATLHAYIDQIDFEGLSYDDSVRKFLGGFRLPGEAQKIDRMMEKFAERYCACNPGVFPTADTAFILAYSIIMLHTDAHNVNIKAEKKMSKDNFIRNNRGIANGADLPPDFLGAIYDSIRARPFTLREDDALRAKVAPVQVDERTRQAQLASERADIVKQGQAAMTTARKQSTARLLAVAAEAEAAGAAAAAAEAAAQSAAQDGAPTPASAAALIADLGLSYYSVQDVLLADHVRPMFDVTWGALLATFSVNFEAAVETPEGIRTVEACLHGFNQAIHVAGCLQMLAERDMLVSSLCKFTLLEQSQSSGSLMAGAGGASAGLMKEFRGKHVAAMRALLAMAFNEGHNLGAAWGPVLVCVSSLARLVNLSAGGKEDAAFFSAPPAQAISAATASNPAAARREAERLRQATERDATVERLNASLVGAHVREADLTRLYTRSVSLPSGAIVDFVTQLAAVSIQELSGVVSPVADFPAIGGGSAQRHDRGLQPRVFSLQKVVEVADYNMAIRPRMAWARIWDSLSRYFTAVCCSSNTGVAMFAIDSLKQLAVKFMAKPELKSFSFQGKFLYPFLAIMEATSPAALAQSRAQAKKAAALGAAAGGAAGGSLVAGVPTFLQPSPEIRELILHVCANIIRARHGNTRSGWRSFMGVYAAAATDSSELLVSLAFSMAHEIVSTHFEAVVASGAFVDAVKCMVAFGSNVHTLFALRAIDHCTTLGAHLARGHVLLDGESALSLSASSSAAATAAASASAAATAGAVPSSAAKAPREGIAEAHHGDGAAAAADWYALDSAENDDVVDDARDRALQAKLRGGASAAAGGLAGAAAAEGAAAGGVSAAGSRAGRGYSMSNFDGAEFVSPEGGVAVVAGNVDGAEGAEAAMDAFLHENATDAALMAADDVRGGRIRRLTDARGHMRLLWPLLTGLGGLVSSDPRLQVRMRALSALFALLRRYGPGFTPELWSLVYGGVLLPIFDDVRHAAADGEDDAAAMAVNALHVQAAARAATKAATSSGPSSASSSSSSSSTSPSDLEGGDATPHFSLSEFSTHAIPNPTLDASATAQATYWPARKKLLAAHAVLVPRAHGAAAPGQGQGAVVDEHEWLRTTCMPALSSLVKIQTRFFERLGFLLPALLRLIEACVDQEIEGLARIGVASLRLLLAEAGPRFTTPTWGVVTGCLARLFRSCTPSALHDARRSLLGGPPTAEELAAAAAAQAREEEDAAADAAAFSAAEAAAAAAAAAAAGAAQAAEEAAFAARAEASTLAVQAVAARVAATAYGRGELLSVRDDGSAVVRLAWSTLYANSGAAGVADVLAATAAAEAAPRPAAEAAAAALAVASAAADAALAADAAALVARPGQRARTALPTATARPANAATVQLPFSSQRVVTQCVVQLELIGCVGVLADAHLDSLELEQVDSLLGLLQQSADFARLFNADRELRRALWECGFMRFAKHNKLPSLLRQESTATQQLLILLLRLYRNDAASSASGAPKPWRALAIRHLISLIRGVLMRYTQLAVDVERSVALALPPHMQMAMSSPPSSAERDALLAGDHSKDLFREAAAYAPIVLQLLDGVLGFDEQQFRANLGWLYPLLTGLIACGSVEIRARVRDVFDSRLRALLPFAEIDTEIEAAAAGAGEGAHA